MALFPSIHETHPSSAAHHAYYPQTYNNCTGVFTPMISVIIPTFNEEENIAQCLVSLSHQTVPRCEYEIIVVDGGSKDATCEIARKYADKVFTPDQQKSRRGAK